jgi:hypothetical protein
MINQAFVLFFVLLAIPNTVLSEQRSHAKKPVRATSRVTELNSEILKDHESLSRP